MSPGVSAYERSPRHNTTTSLVFAAAAAAATSISLSTSTPGTYVARAPALEAIAVRIVGRSFGYSAGRSPCQVIVQPLFNDGSESHVGPVIRIRASGESGRSRRSFFNSTIDSRAAASARRRDAAEPTSVAPRTPRSGSSNTPSRAFIVRTRVTASSMRRIGTAPSFTSCARRSLKL